MDTLSAMNDATQAMKAKGSLSREDIPTHFRERCTGLEAFVTAVNGELRALNYRRELRQRLEENRSVAWGQYTDISRELFRLSQELGSLNGADPLAERRLIRFLRGMDIDAETAVYRDGRGRLRVVVESGRLSPLTRQEDWLEKLSSVVGVRLCQPEETPEGSSRLTLLEAEPLAVSVGIAAMKKKGESVNGDKGSYFKTDEGVLCVILSDGMGSGSEAARDSARVVEILERFLRSGTEPAIAMRILNSVMLLRSGEEWGYATVDLMCVDLFSGEACFYKYGAAPSYVKNGNKIRRIESESLAPGLCPGDGSAPDVVRMKLRPGSTALIATDGVIAARDDEWLRELLKDGRPDMKGLAKTALRAAEEQYGAVDDMTVIAVRLDKRV
jgi:stage II sporulation protein E